MRRRPLIPRAKRRLTARLRVLPPLLAVGLLLAPLPSSAASLGGLKYSLALVTAAVMWLALQGVGAELSSGLLPAGSALLALGLALALMLRAGWNPKGVGRHPTRAAQAGAPTGVSFDTGQLLAGARCQFVQLQAAWDAGDTAALAALTTPDVLDDLCRELAARGDGVNRTDVLMLDAQLLALDELASAFLASIEFSGLIREGPDRDAAPFKEIWLMTLVKGEPSTWRLARQQSLI